MENISQERAIELLKKLVANMRYGGKPLVVAKHLLYVGFEPEELLELGFKSRSVVAAEEQLDEYEDSLIFLEG